MQEISLKYIINIINFLQGNLGPLPRSKMEFFATVLNSWKLLYIGYCLKESHLICGRVSEFAFNNHVTLATFCWACYFMEFH